jgi:hypothetical protein
MIARLPRFQTGLTRQFCLVFEFVSLLIMAPETSLVHQAVLTLYSLFLHQRKPNQL